MSISIPVILAEVPTAVASAQLVEWHWPAPSRGSSCPSQHLLVLPLPRYRAATQTCYPEISPHRYSPVGEIFLRPAGVNARFRSSGGHVRVLRCVYEPEQFSRMSERNIEWTGSELQRCLDLSDATIRMMLERVYKEVIDPGFASAALIESLCIALMVETISVISAPDRQHSVGTLTPWQFRRITERILEVEAPPTVQELAHLCRISPRHLLRKFHNLTGISVLQHIERAQIAKARRLLLGTSLPLKDVAARLGFCHQSNFARAFRRATDQTPRDYRRTFSSLD